MEIEDDLAQIERGIRELQIDWEKFFAGIDKKPPVDRKTRLEALIRKYATTEIRNNTLRFRYQTLSARYATFSELWGKRLRALEEGRPVAGVRTRVAAAPALAPPSDEATAPAYEVADEGSPLEDLLGVLDAPPPPPPKPRLRPTGELRVADPAREKETVRALYEQFVDARKKTGESANVKYESFEKLIAQQASRILSDKGASAVDFRLETKDGKVSLKAKPVK